MSVLPPARMCSQSPTWLELHPTISMLTMGLLGQTHAPSCVHPLWQPRPQSTPLRLSPHNQTKASHWVCPLKHEFYHPATACTSKCASWAGKCGDTAATICAGPSLPCLAASQLPHHPLEQILSHSSSPYVPADL